MSETLAAAAVSVEDCTCVGVPILLAASAVSRGNSFPILPRWPKASELRCVGVAFDEFTLDSGIEQLIVRLRSTEKKTNLLLVCLALCDCLWNYNMCLHTFLVSVCVDCVVVAVRWKVYSPGFTCCFTFWALDPPLLPGFTVL